MDLAHMSSAWLSNPWLTWGLGAYLASSIGFLLAAAVLELVLSSGMLDGSFISYASSSHKPRRDLLAETHKRLPFRLVAVPGVRYTWACLVLP